MFHLEILEIVLQDDGGGNFIHEPLVRLTTFASDTGCDDCLVSNDGSIAFVVEHYWNFRQSLPKFSCEAAHAALILRRRTRLWFSEGCPLGCTGSPTTMVSTGSRFT